MAEHDMIRLHFVTGARTFHLSAFGLSWPPPERLVVTDDGSLREATTDDAFVLKRVSMSQFTDEEIAQMPGVVRGAEYRYVDKEGRDA